MSLKHISRLGIGLLVLLGASSCSDDFLAVVPPTAVPDSVFVNNSSDLKQVLNASYEALSKENFAGGKLQLMNELPADNINGSTIEGDWKAAYERSVGVFNSVTREVIAEGYKVVNRANYVLENVDRFSDLAASDKLAISAEARFLRGVAHFELVRLFAQPYGFSGSINGKTYTNNAHPGIPLRLKYGTEQLGRSTVSEVYASVIEDLKFAEANLTDTEGAGGRGHATRMSARGYLAKVYFQMNDFTNAYDYSNQVISSGLFALDSLGARYGTAWSSENVFAMYSANGSDNTTVFFNSQYAFDPIRKEANIAFSNSLYALVANTSDNRSKWFLSASGLNWSTKFAVGRIGHNQLCHLTELLLIRGESAAELGNLTTAIADINAIRSRAGLIDIDAASTASVVIENARTQRRLELYAEGNRVQDLKRVGALLASRGDNTFTIRGSAWDCPGLVYQFPDNELSGNLDIEPNPTGGCN